jgi:TRAP-type C4-dicarboxylate transport system permease small subunit
MISHYLSRLNDYICKIAVILVAVGLIVICSIMFSAVVARYAFNSPISWGEDATSVLLIWTVLLGAPIGLRNNGHVAIDLFWDKWPKLLRDIAMLISDVVITFVAITIVVYGFPQAIKSMNRVLGSMEWLKYGYVYLALPVGYGLLSIVCLEKFILSAKHLLKLLNKKEKIGE